MTTYCALPRKLLLLSPCKRMPIVRRNRLIGRLIFAAA
ncbi:hypothetical protein FB004_101134 [Sinorhizobium medicae]|nr:hypothetical protein FB004_101134 [Sinorhizobium medicae]TWA30403.1 hypothetical protein FB006_101472 [Sinorhizobium medicae]TWA42334.1 hypothetical protein FB007_101497 [Sinorhizobium medicae]TWA44766.1 hypothetical protein FB009_101522 [Sinorhizobium medicae]TWA48746.1 hypothetical protein FB005_101135 [Sinorhizobium medicae]